MSESAPTGYSWDSAKPEESSRYLWNPILSRLEADFRGRKDRRVFELGCGNGAFAAALAGKGYQVTGIDPSEDGIRIAKAAHPHLELHAGSAYEDLASRFGRFPALVSLEVVEHVFYPRKYAKCVHDLIEPGGVAYISTPYHGYLKNVLVALTGNWDHHHDPLWDYGHIKFWSRETLSKLLEEAGLKVEGYLRVGRIPAVAKSMVAIARRPL